MLQTEHNSGTKRRHARELLRLLARVTAASGSDTAADKVFQEILGTVCEVLGWEFAHFLPVDTECMLVTRTTRTLHAVNDGKMEPFTQATLRLRPRQGEGISGKALQTGLPQWSANLNADEPLRSNAARECGITCLFVFPLLIEDRTVALMEFAGHEEDPQDPDLYVALHQVSLLASRVLERICAVHDHERANEELELQVMERTLSLANANETLMSEIEERRKAESLKDELVSTVSHELRTPLASLRGFTELMIECEMPREQAVQYLEIIQKETVRLTELINDFLDLQRIESGKLQYVIEPTDLRELIDGSVTVFAGKAGRHRFRIDIPQDLPRVLADKGRLQQVMANLLANALKFSPNGGRVSIGALRTAGEILVWIGDEGLGISPQVQAKLFQKFVRADNADTRAIGGTGLGLALVKKVIDAHGGRVWVESQVGVGSTFQFSLPHEQASIGDSPEGPQHAQVLLVGLTESNSAQLQPVLEKLQMPVIGTGEVSEASLDTIRRIRPKLAIVDLSSGALNWEFLIALRNDPIGRWTPVIALHSAACQPCSLPFHGAAYLPKPLVREDFEAVLKGLQSESKIESAYLVDDDSVSRLVVSTYLRKHGIRDIHEHDESQDVLERMEIKMPDLLVMDLSIPNIDGFAILRWLRANPRAHDIRVVVVTSKNLLPNEVALIKRPLAYPVAVDEDLQSSLRRAILELISAGESLQAA